MLAMVSVIGAELWRRGGVRPADEDLPVLGNVPAFQFHDQDDKPVTLASLRGSPWVADFIFTSCPGACPMMTGKMAALQKSLPPQVKFVSFSVDPEHDTPAVLKEYAQRFSADESRWMFLTGDQDAIMAQARGMLLTALPATADQPIIHDGRFVLIDGRGHIRGAYHSNDPQTLAELDRDAKRLVAEDSRNRRLGVYFKQAPRNPFGDNGASPQPNGDQTVPETPARTGDPEGPLSPQCRVRQTFGENAFVG
jgi:protein SCO1